MILGNIIGDADDDGTIENLDGSRYDPQLTNALCDNMHDKRD